MMGPGGEKLPGEHQLSSRTEYGTTTYTVFVLETIPWQPLILILDLCENGLDVYTDLFGAQPTYFLLEDVIPNGSLTIPQTLPAEEQPWAPLH